MPLPPAETILHIGANRGQFALVALERLPSESLLSFEPPRAFTALGALAKDEPRLRVHRVAGGTDGGTATLHISRRDDSSSLLPITGKQVAFAPGSGEPGQHGG